MIRILTTFVSDYFLKYAYIVISLGKKGSITLWGKGCTGLLSARFEGLGSLRFNVRLPRWLSGKESTCREGNPGLSHGLGRSSGEENDNPLQYSCLGNPMDRQPGTLQSMWSQRMRHNSATEQKQQLASAKPKIYILQVSTIAGHLRLDTPFVLGLV